MPIPDLSNPSIAKLVEDSYRRYRGLSREEQAAMWSTGFLGSLRLLQARDGVAQALETDQPAVGTLHREQNRR